MRIGSNIIVGAGSVITSNLESNYVYAGNPARKIHRIEDYLLKHKNPQNIYIESDTFKNDKLTIERKKEIKEEIKRHNFISYSK